MRTLLLYFAALLLFICCDVSKSKMRARLERVDSLIYGEQHELADKELYDINNQGLSEDGDKALYYLLKFQNDFILDEETEADSLIYFSIDYFKRKGDYGYLARAYYYKGASLLLEDSVKKALLFMKKAEEAEMKAEIPWLRHLICNNMSLINIYLDANLAALEYAEKSLKCAIENDNIPWLCAAYNSKALCFYQMGRKDSAEFYLDKTLPYINKIEGKEFRSVLFTNMGVIYYDNKMYRKADSLFKQAFNLFPDVTTRINLAKTRYMLGDSAESDSLLKEAWPNASVEDRVEILQFRAEMADKAGDYAASSRFYKEAQALQDSARRAMKTEEAVTVQRDYERDKYKEDVWRNVLLAFCVVVLLVLSLTFYYRKRINKAKRTISEGNRLIAEYTARISELEKQDASHAGKVNDLKRKIRNLKDGQAAVLGNGLRLYDEIAAGGTTATWSKKEFDEFIEYYRVGHAEAVAYAENGYRRLSSSNIFYLLLLDMGRDDADVQRTMCMTPGALRTMKSRINAKKVV